MAPNEGLPFRLMAKLLSVFSTGALLFGFQPDACHALPSQPEGALPYSSELTSIRSFHRICDGLRTVALVDREGLMVELVDVTAAGVVSIRFHGACHGCPSSTMTLQMGIERNLRERVPEVTQVIPVT